MVEATVTKTPSLDQEDAPFLAVDLVVGEMGIVEEVAAGQHADDADAGIDQHAERDQRLDQSRRHDAAGPRRGRRPARRG